MILLLIPLAPAPQPARAKGIGGGISRVVPLVGVLVGWSRRNRVYRSANRFIADRNQYYDGLRDVARGQLLKRQIYTRKSGSQARAYVKVVALIELERAGQMAMAEARKRQARAQFHEELENTARFALAGTQLAQHVLGALQNGVGSARTALDRALNAVTGGGPDALQHLRQIRDFARKASLVSNVFGGRAGSRLRDAFDRIAKAAGLPEAKARAALENIRGDLDFVAGRLDVAGKVGRTPSAGVAIDQPKAGFVPEGGEKDPSLDAISFMLSKLAIGNGSLRDDARKALQNGFRVRMAAYSAAFQANLRTLQSDSATEPGDEPAPWEEEASRPVITPKDLAGGMPPATGDEAPPGWEIPPPEEPEPLPVVTASGQYSETVSAGGTPMGSSFRLTADFAAGTITIGLSGGRATPPVQEQCASVETGAITESTMVTYREAYTAQASGGLDPESGAFSATFAPTGSTSGRALFTDPQCVHLNSQPPPGQHTWPTGAGSITGTVGKDGFIAFATSWSHCGTHFMKGAWEGQGSVSIP